MTNPEWRDMAACGPGTAGLFHGPDREDPRARDAREAAAVAVCGSCPAAGPCLAAALAEGDRHAVRGGTTPRQRIRLHHEAGALADRETCRNGHDLAVHGRRNSRLLLTCRQCERDAAARRTAA